MTPQALLTAYRQVADRHQLPAMELAGLEISARDIDDPRAAWRALVDLAPVAGWMQFQSHIATFDDERIPDPNPDWGSLLAAECVDVQGRSIHLRQNGAGGLRLTLATPVPAEEGAADMVLADAVEQLATAKAPGPLRHRRYWTLVGDDGARPVFASFQGFARKEED